MEKINLLNRLYGLLSLFALGWVAFVGWDIYVDWDRYPEDRGVTIFIGAFPLIVLAALNYLLHGRVSPFLQHPEGGKPRPRAGKDGYRSE